MENSPNLYERVVRWLGRRRWFSWFGRHVLTPLDRRAYGHRYAPTTFGTHFPLCYLTVVGAVSGEPHTVPLLYVRANDTYAVAASAFGARSRPAWSHNLDAAGGGVLRIGDEEVPVRSRRAEAAEAKDLWRRFDELWPPFADYRRRARREVPIHLLTRNDGPGAPG
jgi:deazaflavin-dependent oxidoreductase (nitroreductase family)